MDIFLEAGLRGVLARCSVEPGLASRLGGLLKGSTSFDECRALSSGSLGVLQVLTRIEIGPAVWGATRILVTMDHGLQGMIVTRVRSACSALGSNMP